MSQTPMPRSLRRHESRRKPGTPVGLPIRPVCEESARCEILTDISLELAGPVECGTGHCATAIDVRRLASLTLTRCSTECQLMRLCSSRSRRLSLSSLPLLWVTKSLRPPTPATCSTSLNHGDVNLWRCRCPWSCTPVECGPAVHGSKARGSTKSQRPPRRPYSVLERNSMSHTRCSILCCSDDIGG
jgi:hypothetical protein